MLDITIIRELLFCYCYDCEKVKHIYDFETIKCRHGKLPPAVRCRHCRMLQRSALNFRNRLKKRFNYLLDHAKMRALHEMVKEHPELERLIAGYDPDLWHKLMTRAVREAGDEAIASALRNTHVKSKMTQELRGRIKREIEALQIPHMNQKKRYRTPEERENGDIVIGPEEDEFLRPRQQEVA